MKSGLIVDSLNYKILCNVSFSLERGTFTALIGKNGSGKSLLLECIAGLHDYNGNINVYDNVIKKSQERNIYIGIFEDLFTLIDGTVIENLIEPLINLKLEKEKAKKKAYELSKKLDIENLTHKNVYDLSYSEKKLVAVAKTIIKDPSIILLDNVFDSLDLHYKNKLIKYLKNMKKSIIVFTTNNSEDLMLADNVIILNNGKIIEKDTTNNILEKENVFVKNGINLPFIIDLSYKLKYYGLLEHLVNNSEDLVNELWK